MRSLKSLVVLFCLLAPLLLRASDCPQAQCLSIAARSVETALSTQGIDTSKLKFELPVDVGGPGVPGFASYFVTVRWPREKNANGFTSARRYRVDIETTDCKDATVTQIEVIQ